MFPHVYNIRKWRPMQQTQPGKAENSFIYHGEFVAMKTLVLHIRRLVQHMHDICAIHIRRNSVYSHPNFLVV